MNKLVFSLAAVASLVVTGLRAQDEDTDSMSDEAEPVEVAAAKPKEPEKRFYTLPVCFRADGVAEVRKPGSEAWCAVEEGRHYPLGSAFRTVGAGSSVIIKFGLDSELSTADGGAFATRAQGLGELTRTVMPISGIVKTKFAANFPENLFFFSAPGFTVGNFRGEASIDYTKDSNGDVAVIRCVSGGLVLSGRHFISNPFSAGNEVRIRTSDSCLFTGLYGQRGDVVFKLDQGQVQTRDFSTGEYQIEDKYLDWALSPQTIVQIHRVKPALGERLAVSILTFDAAGQLKNRCAFAEKTFLVNSGEIGPSSQKQREEIAKRAAEASAAIEGDEGMEESDNGGTVAEPEETVSDDDSEF